jgi:hypothetical protein
LIAGIFLIASSLSMILLFYLYLSGENPVFQRILRCPAAMMQSQGNQFIIHFCLSLNKLFLQEISNSTSIYGY